MFGRFRFRLGIVKSLNLFDFASIFTQKQHKVALIIETIFGKKNSREDQLSFEIVIENSYSFRKHNFGTFYWLTCDLESGVRVSVWNYKSTSDPSGAQYEADLT